MDSKEMPKGRARGRARGIVPSSAQLTQPGTQSGQTVRYNTYYISICYSNANNYYLFHS